MDYPTAESSNGHRGEWFGREGGAIDKYLKLGKLGEGTYGVVYKAWNNQTDEVSILTFR